MSLFSVNTNLGALAALLSLDANQQALTAAQNEVSTGKAVSTASDNPAIYAISNKLNANIAGLTAVSSSLNFGAQIVSTATSSLSSINDTLNSLQQTVTSAGQSGIDASQLQSQVLNDLALINATAEKSTFSGVNILAPSSDTASGATLTNMNVVQGVDGSVYNIANQSDAVVPGASTFTQALGLQGLNVSAPVQGVNVSFDSALTLSAFAPNSKIGTAAAADAGSNAAFQLTTGSGATAKTFSFEFIDDSTTDNPTPLNLQSSTAAGNTVVAVHIDTSTESPTQVVSALNAAIASQGFSVATNSDGSLNIVGNGISAADFGTVKAGAFTSGGPGGAANGTVSYTTGSAVVTAGTSGVDIGNLTSSQSLVTVVQAAINTTAKIAAGLGAASNQITSIQNFTTALSSALTAGVGALTDADLAAESAQLTSLQTKQQLATQSLSIANKQPQSLLTLFQGL